MPRVLPLSLLERFLTTARVISLSLGQTVTTRDDGWGRERLGSGLHGGRGPMAFLGQAAGER